jgi:DNA-binding NarL/FixJ family response regulator
MRKSAGFKEEPIISAETEPNSRLRTSLRSSSSGVARQNATAVEVRNQSALHRVLPAPFPKFEASDGPLSLGGDLNKAYNRPSGEVGMPLTKPIRILSVEDHPVFRQGLATIIGTESDMALVGQAANGVEAVAEFRRHRPDITLMDLRLPGSNGTDTLIAIRGEFPQARIIILSTSDSDGEIQRALRAGASGYVLKSMPQDELLAIIRSVHAGRRYIPADVAARLAEHLGEEDLTARELDVLRLIRDGYRNKQIGDKLSISENTVNFHIKNVVGKLTANDRTHAVMIAVRRGLLQI